MSAARRAGRSTPLPPGLLKAMAKHPGFYQKVWKACAAIPRGEVRTYGWLARAVGRPGAARAVGRALAANPFAPRVPCHRVVGAGGRLTGFSGPGGVRAKRRLLLAEGVAPAGLGTSSNKPAPRLRALAAPSEPGPRPGS